jgi:hypothetical protein
MNMLRRWVDILCMGLTSFTSLDRSQECADRLAPMIPQNGYLGKLLECVSAMKNTGRVDVAEGWPGSDRLAIAG